MRHDIRSVSDSNIHILVSLVQNKINFFPQKIVREVNIYIYIYIE